MTSTDRQRVLMLSEHLNSSGSPRVALNVAKHLVGSVKEVAMGYLWGSDALVSEFEDAGVSTVRLGDRFGDPTVLRSLWDLISAYRPTLVHTHMIPASWCGRVVGRLRGVPVVSTIHTPYDDRSLPARGLDLSTSSLPAVNVAVSNAVADSFPPYFGIGTRSAVVHNCIDVEELRARGTVAWEDLEWNEGLSKEQPIVANVARFDPKKRKSDLVRALPVVLEEFPEAIVVLTGWGEGRSRVEELVRSLGVEDSVVFTGDVRNPYSVYRHADVVALPSLSEGFSISLLEAMAFGKPIVATEIPPFREALGPEYPLVSPRDLPALAAAIKSYLSDSERAERAGTVLEERVERRFSGRAATQEYLEVYASIDA